MNPYSSDEQDIFKTGTSISETVPWFKSILRQMRLRAEEQQAVRADITAQPDPSALDKFVGPKSSFRWGLFIFLPFLSVISAIRERNAYQHRKIETTAAPVEVEELWGKDNSGYSGLVSIGLHLLLIAALVIPTFLVFHTPPATATVVMLHQPLILNLPKGDGKTGGGGGGGLKTPKPPSKGQLPKPSDRQFVPPMVERKNLAPDLVIDPTVVAPQMAVIPITLAPFGDPNGVVGPPSAGPGTGGGIGTGTGTGVGSGKGAGVGPGEGGGIGGGVFNVGGGVSEPVVLSQTQPEYSDDGRKARIQGTVELLIVVNADGTVRFDSVRKSLGYGLDQKAIEAVKKWRFIAGKKDGKPVPTYVSVLVNFSLR
jgi:periplasmic protein TonB